MAERGGILRTTILAAIVGIACFFSGALGDAMVLPGQVYSVLWPGSALLLSMLLVSPSKMWPALIPAGILGFVLHDVRSGFSARMIGIFVVADTTETVIAAYGLRYAFAGVPALNSLRSLAKYTFFAVLLAPLCSSFFGALATGGNYWLNWRTWFFSDVIAYMTLTPAVVSWIEAGKSGALRGRKARWEAAALMGALAFFGYAIFLAPWHAVSPALLYCLVPFLIWAALRFGAMGVSTTVIGIAFLSTWGAIQGRGPFVGPIPLHNVVSLELFLMFSAAPFLVLAALVEERKRSQEVVSELSRRLIRAQEEERTRIAGELHDDINQRLTFIGLSLGVLKRSLPAMLKPARNHVEELKQQVVEIADGVRSLSHGLHPPNLEFLGLAAAARSLCKEYSRRHNVEVEFHADELPNDLGREVSLCLFRVLQEALQNASKHSGASQYFVSLVNDRGEVRLCVSDPGRGFDLDQVMKRRGVGLASMKERLKMVNGELRIESRPQSGTTVNARVRVKVKAAGEVP